MQTREQMILSALATQLPPTDACVRLRKESKLRQLPSMLLRHGPVQVVVYLQSKGRDSDFKPDQALLELYLAVLQRVLVSMGRDSPLRALRFDKAVTNDDFERLSRQPLADRIADQTLCVEVANWLNRSIEARYQDDLASKAAT